MNSEVYNLRIGDMIYHPQAFNNAGVREDSAIMAVIYKTTPKYVYYAICARNENASGDHYITRDNRAKKETLYKSIQNGTCFISYANGTRRRKKIHFEEV